MGNCQNYGPFLGPYYNTGPNTGPNLGDPKRDHNFDSSPYSRYVRILGEGPTLALGSNLGEVNQTHFLQTLRTAEPPAKTEPFPKLAWSPPKEDPGKTTVFSAPT